jgi:D-xylose transport system ATP-binding protein
VIKDGFLKREEICAGKVARCEEAGSSRPDSPPARDARRRGGPVLELEGVSRGFGRVRPSTRSTSTCRRARSWPWSGTTTRASRRSSSASPGSTRSTGEIRFGAGPCTSRPKDAARLGIEVVYQDLALADNLDVVQNMFLGREELGSLRRMDETSMEKQATDTLASLSVTTIRSVRQTVAGLSGGQRQSVAVAKAVMWNSKLVILDEPTAALGVAQTRQVLDLVKRLGQQGLAVVIVSHNLHDVFEVADSVTVLRLGQNVAEYRVADVTQTQVVEAITAASSRRSRARPTPRCPVPLGAPPPPLRRLRAHTPSCQARRPRVVGDYARRWWSDVRAGEARFPADSSSADHHRGVFQFLN